MLALGSPTHPVEPRRLDARGRATYDQHWGTLPRPGAPELRAAVRPPVLARLDRLPRHPGRVHARARHRLLREQPARGLRAARLRDRQPAAAGRATAPTSGASPPATGRPTSSCDVNAGEPRAFRSYAARGAGRIGTCSTTARSRRPRRSASHRRSRRRSSIPAIARDARALRRSTSTRKYGFLDAFNPSFTFTDVHAAARPRRPGLRLGRQRLPRHRPGPDRGDDRELPQRARLARDAQATRTCAAASSAPASPAAGWHAPRRVAAPRA